MVVASNPVVEVRRDGDTWTIRMNTLVRTVEYVFEPGQTVETETMGGMAQVGHRICGGGGMIKGCESWHRVGGDGWERRSEGRMIQIYIIFQ